MKRADKHKTSLLLEVKNRPYRVGGALDNVRQR